MDNNYSHSDEVFRRSLNRVLFWSGACVALAWITAAVIVASFFGW